MPKKMFVQATGWGSPFAETVARLEADSSWSVRKVACGHDIAIGMPDRLAGILESAA